MGQSSREDVGAFLNRLASDTAALKDQGLYKAERVITSPQRAEISVDEGAERAAEVINLCANNYLGLADHPEIIAAAQRAEQGDEGGRRDARDLARLQDRPRSCRAQLLRLLVLLCLSCGAISAFLDNVTTSKVTHIPNPWMKLIHPNTTLATLARSTVLLLAPVTIELCAVIRLGERADMRFLSLICIRLTF